MAEHATTGELTLRGPQLCLSQGYDSLDLCDQHTGTFVMSCGFAGSSEPCCVRFCNVAFVREVHPASLRHDSFCLHNVVGTYSIKFWEILKYSVQ